MARAESPVAPAASCVFLKELLELRRSLRARGRADDSRFHLRGRMGDYWTRDERGEQALKWKFDDGLTNEQIAAKLNQICTRFVSVNAVNGFIWRKSRERKGLAPQQRQRRTRAVSTAERKTGPQPKAPGNPHVRALFTGPVDAIRDNTAAEDLSNPSPDRKSLQKLTDKCCRWPVGDPKYGADFHFCGREKVIGLPYCEAHARRAFVPTITAQRNSHQSKLEPAE